MQHQFDWRVLVVYAALPALLGLAGTANAQLEIGGQPFEPNDSAPVNAAGDLLTVVQTKLQLLGFDPGPIGTENQETTVAITTFQVRNGLNPDGLVSRALDAALTVAVNAQRGNNVVAKQSASAAQMPASGNVDGGKISGNDDPCLQQQLGETAAASSNVRSRLSAAGRLLGRFGRKSKAVEEASQVASDVSGTARDTQQIIQGDCQR